MARAKTATARKPTSAPEPDYLKKILTARVYDVAIESPLEAAKSLSRRIGSNSTDSWVRLAVDTQRCHDR